jgi:ribosome-associated protein
MLENNPLLESIIEGIEESKGEEIVVIDLRKVSGAVCDYFVICQGNSTTQTEAIARKVQEWTRKQINERPWKTEGQSSATWILLDYFNIVVHIFTKETRLFYDIEDLWADGEVHYLGEEKKKESGT